MLLTGCGAILNKVSEGARGEAIALQASKFSHGRDFEERKIRLAIIAQSRDDAARDALVELAQRVEDGVLRVAVIDAIQSMSPGWTEGWIGVNDMLTEGHFLWWDGSHPAYTSWDDGQPNNGGTYGEQCVRLFADNKWHDYGCGGKIPYLCRTTLP